MKGLIGYKQVAARLGVAVGTVYGWVSLGRIPCVRFGPRCVRFDPGEIDAWVEQHRRGIRADASKQSA